MSNPIRFYLRVNGLLSQRGLSQHKMELGCGVGEDGGIQMSVSKSEQNRARYDYLKRRGLCVVCGREKALNDRVTCEVCRVRINKNCRKSTAKRALKLIEDKRAFFQNIASRRDQAANNHSVEEALYWLAYERGAKDLLNVIDP